MSVRLTDIAKKLNISPTTVSMALNNKGNISPSLVQAVQQVANKMGYQPKGATSPKTDKKVIKILKIARHGHILNERHNTFFSEYLAGIEHKAKELHCQIELEFLNQSPQEIIEQTYKADGLIVVGSELLLPDVKVLQQLSLPSVFLDASFSYSTIDCFNIDNTDGIFKAVEHLVLAGHQKIGLFKSSLVTSNLEQRAEAYFSALKYFGLKEDDVVSVDPAYNDGFINLDHYLKQGHPSATAFVCVNDIIAYSAIKAFKAHGYSIPQDISLIGFDDLPASSISDPLLTSIRVASYQIGQLALSSLCNKIVSPVSGYQAQKVLVAGSLVIRDSVSPLGVRPH